MFYDTTHSSREFSRNTFFKEEFSTSNQQWSIYKHTTSITSGTFKNVQDFVSNYITYIPGVVDLGCSTQKVVANLATATTVETRNTVYNFDEIHWVDSSIFETSGMSVGNWSQYVASLGMDEFNIYMHNKVQLFVPDLSNNYDKLTANNIKTYNRLSKSNDAKELDIAHLLIPVLESGQFYEIVGPSASLTEQQLENFKEFGENECVESHRLVESLDFYLFLYRQANFTTDEEQWMQDKKLFIPLGVGISIPTADMNSVVDTMKLVKEVTGASVESSMSTECTFSTLSFSSDDHFVPFVRYVQNELAYQGTEYNLKDWEDDITMTHDNLLSSSSDYSQWDRYLDTHIGVMPYYVSEDYCTQMEDFIGDKLVDYNSVFSPRTAEGVHYYVATAGLKCWEFNAYNCSASYTNICGCIASNNEDEYYALHGEVCL
jgi:hypothetical protein